MIIDCIADLHGYYPILEGGDLLIIAGDLTARDDKNEYISFHEWVRKQKYKKIIVIAGNHDKKVEEGIFKLDLPRNITDEWMGFEYLCDSGTEFKCFKIWGAPWTKSFPGMNPKCKAFTCDTEEELASKFSLIPDDIDILVTHSPPKHILDKVKDGTHVGSSALYKRIKRMRPYLSLHIFGHIHESAGFEDEGDLLFINASHVNEKYIPINGYKRVEIKKNVLFEYEFTDVRILNE